MAQGTNTYTAPAPVDDAAIRKAASAQAQTEIAGQTGPLAAQASSLQSRETQAIGDIGSEFRQIQPSVVQAARGVQQSYTQAGAAEAAIFAQANARMAALSQDRASQAQQMAQQTGGPVAVGEFTAPVTPAQESLVNLGAGQQLHTLGYAQAGVQSAQAFAGQVFPLLRTEEEAKARSYYEDQISTIKNQISTIQGTKGALVNSKFNELRTAQLQYNLQQNQQKLDQLNADRTYELQTAEDKQKADDANRTYQLALQQQTLQRQQFLHQASQDAIANARADKTLGIEEAGVTGYYKGKKTPEEIRAETAAAREGRTLAIQEAGVTGYYEGKKTPEEVRAEAEATRAAAADTRAAAAFGLSVADYKLRAADLTARTKIALQTLAANQQANWNAILDGAVNPRPGGEVVTTNAVPVSRTAAILGKVPDAYADPKSPTGYSHLVTVRNTSVTDPITNPNLLYKFMTAHGVPGGRAADMIRSRFNIPSWKPGQKVTPKTATKVVQTVQANAPQGPVGNATWRQAGVPISPAGSHPPGVSGTPG